MKKRLLILVLVLLPVYLCIWYLSPLFTSNLHIIDDFTGRLCPCSFGEVESENDGSFRLQVHDGEGEIIWVTGIYKNEKKEIKYNIKAEWGK
jgi:hypothetical protein